jgi:hypothetical protein
MLLEQLIIGLCVFDLYNNDIAAKKRIKEKLFRQMPKEFCNENIKASDKKVF